MASPHTPGSGYGAGARGTTRARGAGGESWGAEMPCCPPCHWRDLGSALGGLVPATGMMPNRQTPPSCWVSAPLAAMRLLRGSHHCLGCVNGAGPTARGPLCTGSLLKGWALSAAAPAPSPHGPCCTCWLSPPAPVSSVPVVPRYVLLHHVMGELQGQQGAWAYVAGGMGALSNAIACAAAAHGAHIVTEKVLATPSPCREQCARLCGAAPLGPCPPRRCGEGHWAGIEHGGHSIAVGPAYQSLGQGAAGWSPVQGRPGHRTLPQGGSTGPCHKRCPLPPALGTNPPCPQPVARVLVGTNGAACGVALGDGTELRSRLVLSNASPQHTFLQLVPQVRRLVGG